ncbi:hypothetical protein PAPYR_10190 [Paratrimastix pyriformis]|uniref:Acyl-CoA N-acyltransferase n=1 Tax=Paratrimastix pyriformis TaxID=342808 RepID=A0ABQ8UAN1_9EUKA|nr:hypothetical protein PAPYR_10190 [Paratrimastix pyriformis]
MFFKLHSDPDDFLDTAFVDFLAGSEAKHVHLIRIASGLSTALAKHIRLPRPPLLVSGSPKGGHVQCAVVAENHSSMLFLSENAGTYAEEIFQFLYPTFQLRPPAIMGPQEEVIPFCDTWLRMYRESEQEMNPASANARSQIHSTYSRWVLERDEYRGVHPQVAPRPTSPVAASEQAAAGSPSPAVIITPAPIPSPAPTEPHARLATADDIDLVARWLAAFYAESRMAVPDARGPAAKMIEGRTVMIWMDRVQDGGSGPVSPVSMAAFSDVHCLESITKRHAVASVNIGCIYTPPELRRRHFGLFCTSSLSEHVFGTLGMQRVYVLADRLSPGAQAICRRVGMEDVATFAQVTMTYG